MTRCSWPPSVTLLPKHIHSPSPKKETTKTARHLEYNVLRTLTLIILCLVIHHFPLLFRDIFMRYLFPKPIWETSKLFLTHYIMLEKIFLDWSIKFWRSIKRTWQTVFSCRGHYHGPTNYNHTKIVKSASLGVFLGRKNTLRRTWHIACLGHWGAI